MDNLYSITGFQWFVIFAVSFIWGCLGFYLGTDLIHRLKLLAIMTIGSFAVLIVGRMLWFFG